MEASQKLYRACLPLSKRFFVDVVIRKVFFQVHRQITHNNAKPLILLNIDSGRGHRRYLKPVLLIETAGILRPYTLRLHRSLHPASMPAPPKRQCTPPTDRAPKTRATPKAAAPARRSDARSRLPGTAHTRYRRHRLKCARWRSRPGSGRRS